MGASEWPRVLAQARSRFETWRSQRRPGERIPAALWRLAVRLAGRHGVHRTAEALRVDYYSLKKRSEATAPEAGAAEPAFFELPTPALVGKQCLIERDNHAGGRTRVQLLGYDAPEIETLARTLWTAD